MEKENTKVVLDVQELVENIFNEAGEGQEVFEDTERVNRLIKLFVETMEIDRFEAIVKDFAEDLILYNIKELIEDLGILGNDKEEAEKE